MTASSASFHEAFIEALYGRVPHDSRVAALVDQPGFTVYRNTVFQGCVDALVANFPAVVRLVGEEWFRAAAAEYVHLSPPTDPRLLQYGEGLPTFLASFEAVKALPYLPSVAHLDGLWIKAHVAAEGGRLSVADFMSWPSDSLERATLCIHPSACWCWFADEPIYTIWRASRERTDVPEPLVWQGEGVLLVRPFGEVQWHALSIGACAFLDACAAGCDLETAAQRALACEPDMDLGHWVSTLLTVGAMADITRREDIAAAL